MHAGRFTSVVLCYHAVSAAWDHVLSVRPEVISELGVEMAPAEMGQTARWEAQARFCASKIIKEYENFYERVLERKV